MKKKILSYGKKIALLATFLSFGLGARAVTYNSVVAKDGSGNYTTVQAAFNAVPTNSSSRYVIYIKNGTYTEVLTLASNKPNVTIIGESRDGVKLTYNNYASKINPATGAAYGTSGSSSTYIYGAGFYATNITFENSSGPVGQALAIYVGCDKVVFNNCRFLGNQDTYYGAAGRNYFLNCYIEGTTDFIFGASTAFFQSCNLYTKGGSAITAASTESYVAYGYVFQNCTITGSGTAITDLGRPWRPYAAVAFLNSSLSGAIKATGWNNWGNAANEATARYGEYNNTGAGSSMSGRPAWIARLTSTQAANYTMTNVLKTTYANPPVVDNWNPTDVINSTTLAATLTKHGAGSSSQAGTVGTAITSFYYTWANATGVTVTGLPSGITSTINNSAKTVTISGTPTVSGTYKYTITTTGGSPNASKSGTFTISAAKSSISQTSGSSENELFVGEFLPNPSCGITKLTIILPIQAQILTALYSTTGVKVANVEQKLYNTGENVIEISTSDIKPGLYIVRININGQIINKQLIIK